MDVPEVVNHSLRDVHLTSVLLLERRRALRVGHSQLRTRRTSKGLIRRCTASRPAQSSKVNKTMPSFPSSVIFSDLMTHLSLRPSPGRPLTAVVLVQYRPGPFPDGCGLGRQSVTVPGRLILVI